MNQKNILIGVLVIAVIILGWLWIDTRNDLQNVLANFGSDTRDYQAEIRAKCGENATQAEIEANEECQEVLQNLSDALKDYQGRLENADVSGSGAEAN